MRQDAACGIVMADRRKPVRFVRDVAQRLQVPHASGIFACVNEHRCDA